MFRKGPIELALWLQALLVPVLFAFSTQGSTDIFSSVLTLVFSPPLILASFHATHREAEDCNLRAN